MEASSRCLPIATIGKAAENGDYLRTARLMDGHLGPMYKAIVVT